LQTWTVKQLVRTVVLTASAVVVGLVSPGPSQAASPKVDVCHREGNGSFNLINIAYQAVQAHRAHGDALPGETVPGNPGYIFDDPYAQVARSACPCDFSLQGLAEVGIDGNPEQFPCLVTFHSQTYIKQGPNGFQAAGVDPLGASCERRGTDGQDVEFIGNLTTDQLEACLANILADATALGITTCN
jgi:hypothetical protein